MTMRYFKNSSGAVYGYDPTIAAQASLIADAVAAQWTEVTGSWPPTAPDLTLAQQAAAASVAGMEIDLNGTVALFPTDAATQGYINAEVTSLLLNSTFADGTTTVEWPDMTGALHNLSVPQFKAVAGAIGGYVAACRKCVIGSVGAVLPASSITITV